MTGLPTTEMPRGATEAHDTGENGSTRRPSDYARVERAITYLVEHAAEQPSLEVLSAQVNLSPFHFQRLFCRWAGTTPKRFLQVLTLERGKNLLNQSRSLLDASLAVGLSGGSRLHDHFVALEAVTPGEYKAKGKGVHIAFGIHPTPFGEMFVAVTPRGICRAAFLEESCYTDHLTELGMSWPLATIHRDESTTHYVIDALFTSEKRRISGPLSLCVTGTNFQVAVWRALLNIPAGAVTSYSELAASLGYPKAPRAVGNAVGANPIALLIPCHRVIQRSGALGGYRWGVVRKQMIQTWERMHADACASE